jgi:hypothetical protein
MNSDPRPIKFSVFGAAQVTPMVLIAPAKSHPEVEIYYAVAARNEKKAVDLGTKHVIPKIYGGRNTYQGTLHTLDRW